MGHREDLLVAAKKCLYERGYTNTTARDLVAASGTNLASIGYHFGSKEALLNAVLEQALDEWGDRVRETVVAKRIRAGDPLARFTAIWSAIIESFEKDGPLWTAVFEALVQAQHAPRIRQLLSNAMQHGRERIAATQEKDGTLAGAKRLRTSGAFFQALMLGVAAQWLVDPKRAPSSRDLAKTLRAMTEAIQASRDSAREE
jgi:AcrR family transcriptional regulator